MVSATIKDAKTCKISKLCRKKPLGLSFADTDAVILTLKTADGKTIKETFYVALSSNGKFVPNPVNRYNRARQERFADFLRHYRITKDVGSFNVREEIDKFKGKKVSVVPYKDTGYIQVF